MIAEQLFAQGFDFLPIVQLQRRVLDLGNRDAQFLVQCRLALGAVEHLALGFALPQKTHHRLRLRQNVRHGLRPSGADDVIGVLSRRHNRKAQPLTRLQQRQRKVDHPHRRAQPCRIPVQRDDRLGRNAPQHVQLMLGHGGAKGGHSRAKPRLGQGDHVHIALGHDQGIILTPCGLTGGAVIVQTAPLIKQVGLGRVQVFRVVIGVHGPPTKGDGPPPRITDGEHDPVAKHVIGFFAAIGWLGQTGSQNQFRRNALARQVVPQVLPPLWREPDFPAVKRGRRQATTGQIIARRPCRTGLQLQAEELNGLLHHLNQLGAAVGLLCGFGIAGGHGHPRLTGKDFNRLHEPDVFRFLNERQGVALGVTAKAVIEPLTVIHMKRRGFFVMERAWRPQVALALVRLALVPHDFAPDHLGQGHTCSQFV